MSSKPSVDLPLKACKVESKHGLGLELPCGMTVKWGKLNRSATVTLVEGDDDFPTLPSEKPAPMSRKRKQGRLDI